jgi:hypothetical protein
MKFSLSEALADLLAQIHSRHAFQTELSGVWQRIWEVDELEAMNERLEHLQEQKSAAWDEYQRVRGPIRKFVTDLNLVLERLPLVPEWTEFKTALLLLRCDRSEAWMAPPRIPDLESVAFRLEEMLGLVQSLPNGKVAAAPKLSKRDQGLHDHIVNEGGDFRIMSNPELIARTKISQMRRLGFSESEQIRSALKRIRNASGFPSSIAAKRSNAVNRRIGQSASFSNVRT